MMKLPESLLLLGLVVGLGCQHTLPQSETTPTEPENVQAAAPSVEAKPTSASAGPVTAPVRK